MRQIILVKTSIGYGVIRSGQRPQDVRSREELRTSLCGDRVAPADIERAIVDLDAGKPTHVLAP